MCICSQPNPLGLGSRVLCASLLVNAHSEALSRVMVYIINSDLFHSVLYPLEVGWVCLFSGPFYLPKASLLEASGVCGEKRGGKAREKEGGRKR